MKGGSGFACGARGGWNDAASAALGAAGRGCAVTDVGDDAAGDDAAGVGVVDVGPACDAAAACDADEPVIDDGGAAGAGRGANAARAAEDDVDAAGALGSSTPTVAWYFFKNASSAATSPSGSL